VNFNRLSKPRWWQERLRSAPTTKCVLAGALVILLALGAPVHADDPIAEWLKKDESDGQNDQVRPDLHALTDEQLQDIFNIGRDQGDGHQLIERVSEQHPRVFYIWDSCGIWRGNRCSQNRAFCAPSTENFGGPSANKGSKH
jgi:plasmid stabilization system protein ParE